MEQSSRHAPGPSWARRATWLPNRPAAGAKPSAPLPTSTPLELIADRPNVPAYRSQLYSVWADLARQLSANNNAEAELAWRQSLAQTERLVADYPDDAAHRNRVIQRRGQMADWLDSLGRRDEAAALRALPPPR